MPEADDAALEKTGQDMVLLLDVFSGVLYDMAAVHHDGISIYIVLASFASIFGEDVKRMASEEEWRNIEALRERITELARDRIPRVYVKV